MNACGRLDNARLPSMEEMASIWINRPFFNTENTFWYMTSTKKMDRSQYSSTQGMVQPIVVGGYTMAVSNTYKASVHCLKRDTE